MTRAQVQQRPGDAPSTHAKRSGRRPRCQTSSRWLSGPVRQAFVDFVELGPFGKRRFAISSRVMAEPIVLAGTFWTAEDGNRVAPGSVRMENARLQLDLEQALIQPEQLRVTHMPHGETRVDHVGDPAVVVSDFKPRIILGRLDNGSAVTLLDAHMHTDWLGWEPGAQRFTGYRLVVGAHLKDVHAPTAAVRWTFPISASAAGWLTSEEIISEAGLLRGWTNAGNAGLEFRPADPWPLRRMAELLPNAVTAFVQLWTGETLKPRRIEIQSPADGVWCAYGLEHHEADEMVGHSDLLPTWRLTLEHLANWLDLTSKLGPLPFVALAESSRLQLDAQRAAAALEGLHRRLAPERRFFASLPRTAVDKARRAAVSAGAHELLERGWKDEASARRRLREGLAHVDQLTYAERLEELVEPVRSLAPGLMGPDLNMWLKLMTAVRNEQSHQLDTVDDFDDSEISRYYVALSSATWTLQLRMLLEIIPEDELKNALNDSSRFMLALANIDREQFWPNFSALDEFRQSRPDAG